MEQQLIYKRIIGILNDVGFIGKDKRNLQQNYQFRGIDDFYNGLHVHFAKHGVFIAPNVIESNREERGSKSGGVLIYTIIKVAFKFYTEDGSCVETIMEGEGMDSGDKSCNKALSAALKNALTQMLLIPTEEKKDAEFDNPELSRKEEVLHLIEKCGEANDLTTLRGMYGDLFLNDKEVIAAGKKKYKEITSKTV